MNKTDEKYIELYPSHWFFNASVIGFVISLRDIENISVNNLFFDDGRINIEKGILKNLNVNERYFSENKISSIVAKAQIYRNYLQASDKIAFPNYVRELSNVELSNNGCSICNIGYDISVEAKKRLSDNGLEKFIDRISSYNMIFNANFGPSKKEFPNAFWVNQHSDKVCSFCSFLLIHQHIGLTRLIDGTNIFINAPTFKLMYHLNRFLNSSISGKNKMEHKDKRTLLAMSVIEYASKTNSLLGQWTGMNIEIISQKGKEIDFFSLPYETVQLISNKQIAGQLSSIGEFKILNIVLDGRFKQLVDLGYQFLKISLKSVKNKADDKFINDFLFLWQNKKYLNQTANKILKLYALIETKLNKLKH